jgi:hypothetical protein
VIPATNGHARPDPIVPLLGGPGEAATESGQCLERLTPMLDDRDLLLVDNTPVTMFSVLGFLN